MPVDRFGQDFALLFGPGDGISPGTPDQVLDPEVLATTHEDEFRVEAAEFSQQDWKRVPFAHAQNLTHSRHFQQGQLRGCLG